MNMSDDLKGKINQLLEAKPRLSFNNDGCDVLDKGGNCVRSFKQKDLGEKYKKSAEVFLQQNYKTLNSEGFVWKESKLQEISRSTMGSYIKKASSDAANKSADAVHQYRDDTDDKKAFKTQDKADKRLKGIKIAVKKLTKESKLQEISTKTMRSYVGKAKNDLAHHQNIQRAADKGMVSKSDPAVKFHKKEEKKRKEGIGTALDKIAKKSIDKNVKNESNEYKDDLADRIRSHENKQERKKAEKAFTVGDYEKATGHIGGTYREK